MKHRKKVLIVDDSSTVRLMETLILANAPYDVITAADGNEGISRAEAEQPDAILLDVVMPNMDGFEACSVLRSMPETARTPIIMVTTRGEEPNVERGYAHGCTDYITKPINAVELLTKLRVMLGD